MPRSDRKLTIDELDRVPVDGYRPRTKVVVVLDDVRSRHNVGSIFRSADSFGVEHIDLCGFTPCPPHREIEKTALGATLSVPWKHHADVLACLQDLKARGYRVLAIEQTSMAMPMEDLVIGAEEPVALVFGNELSGVSDQVIDLSDQCVVIPQFGSKHSLNVSVCAGIVMWWFAGRDR